MVGVHSLNSHNTVMAQNGLVLIGTRPPSVTDFRPRSSAGTRGHYGYQTIADTSTVDETLFRTHNPRMSEEINFRPPWGYKKKSPEEQLQKSKGRPLLWSPQPSISLNGDVVANHSSMKTNTGHTRYRLWKHTPTFVDEGLFGSALAEPSFEAPWGEKKKMCRPYIWVPESPTTSNSGVSGTNKRVKLHMSRRPKTALGNRTSPGEGDPKPVWRP